MRIILASASPRRKEICDLLGIKTTVIPASAERPFDETLTVEENVLQTARAKAEEIAAVCGTAIPVLGADTTVAVSVDGRWRTLGKPENEEDARRMLRLLQGREHRVLTGVWVCGAARSDGFVSAATVVFDPMTEAEIADYVATGEPMDKAGAYAIQGRCLRYIRKIDGDFYTVMGLPSASLWQFLQIYV